MVIQVGVAVHWCKPSGSNFITNNPAAENDPDDICENPANQNTGVGPGVKSISACYEDRDNFFTNVDLISSTIDSAGKANLGLSSTLTSLGAFLRSMIICKQK